MSDDEDDTIERLQNMVKKFHEQEEGKGTTKQEEITISSHFKKKVILVINCQKYARRWYYRREWLKIKKMVWRRNLIAQEILETEKTYVKNLNTLATSFLQPISGHPKAGKKGIVKSILSSIEVIKGYNTIILQSLTVRMAKWDTKTKVGDIFLQMAEYLKAYTQYSSLYSQFLEDIDELCQKDKKFSTWVDELRNGREVAETNLYMRDFLIMPIQRIPRYTLLLKDLLSHTWPSHADYNSLRSCYSKISDIASFVNKAQAENSNNLRMQSIKASLSGAKSKTLPLLQPHRRFIIEGEVHDANNGNPRNVYVFMFNDLLLWTKANQTKTKFDLLRVDSFKNYLSVKEILNKSDPTAPKMIGIYEKDRISFFRPISIDDFNLWFNSLQEHVLACTSDINPKSRSSSVFDSGHRRAATLPPLVPSGGSFTPRGSSSGIGESTSENSTLENHTQSEVVLNKKLNEEELYSSLRTQSEQPRIVVDEQNQPQQQSSLGGRTESNEDIQEGTGKSGKKRYMMKKVSLAFKKEETSNE